MMTARLIWAIFSILLEEAAIVAIVLWGLPQMDVHIPLPGLVVLLLAWGAFSIVIYRMGSKALKRKPVTGLADMTDSKGKVVEPLTPNGVIRIKGELWDARSIGRRRIKTGEEVTVVSQDGLRLLVRKSDRKR